MEASKGDRFAHGPMANNRMTPSNKNWLCSGKQSLLPPKSPLPTVSPTYSDYGSSSAGSNGIPKPREGQREHQRAPSESFLMEEQPSWLDDLLNEPETPVKRGSHRRSSSDSFAYLEASSNFPNVGMAPADFKQKSILSVPSWKSLDIDHQREGQRTYLNIEDPFGAHHNKSRESSFTSLAHSSSSSLPRDKNMVQNLGSSCTPRELDGTTSTAIEKQDDDESGPRDIKCSFERKDSAKPSSSETDRKRTKQQHAQRSRVRKLQYIAELERNVQALQAEGMDVSAELEFLGQQHLILSMENKALKQRLDSLAQEQLIKYFEQEVLEREIGRLQGSLCQQQQQLQHLQQQQQPPPNATRHRRGGSRDLDSQFGNLSLRHSDPSSGREPVSRPLHT